MNSYNVMNPSGGANVRRVVEPSDPHLHLLEQGLVSVKELWVKIHYPATAR